MTTKISIDNIQESTLSQLSGGSGSGVIAYATIAELPLSGNDSGSLAFVEENNRLYIWNNVGWFNIALINTNPTITQGPDPSYVFDTNGDPIVITLTATDPEGIPITWSYQITAGTLGDTATIEQNDNVFTFTPSTDDGDSGTFSVTFTASDGVNIATAVSSFTLVFGEEFWSYTTLLLTGDGTNGAQNNTFLDSSANNFTITRNGNTTQGTFSPYGDRWSNYFDGSGDTLTATNSALQINGTYTIDCWIYINDLSQNRGIWMSGTGDTNRTQLLVLSTGAIEIFERTSSPTFVALATSSVGVIQINQWYCVSVISNGSTVKIYVNGTEVASSAITGTEPTENTFRIGVARSGTADRIMNGYISNLRIVKGTALYTSNFTPPTEPLTAITNTALLTCQSNRFIDNSTNNFTITRNGDVSVQRFSPFLPSAAYDASVIGGSGYFDGTGDFLTVADNAALEPSNSDLTWEMWINTTSSVRYATLYSRTPISFGSGMWSLMINEVSSTAGDVALYVANFNGVSPLLRTTGVDVRDGAWHHIAVVRSSSAWVLYVDGVSRATGTWSGTIADISGGPRIGSDQFYTRDYVGYISNLRIIKGTAVYTSNFTPPTAPLTAITNTSLLLNFTNAGIIDNAMMNNIETVGDAQIDTSVKKFGTGSIKFDGNGDYLISPSSPVNSLGNGSFTVEFWVNPTNTSTGYRSLVADERYGSSLAGGWDVYQNGTSIEVWQTVTTSGSSLISRSSVLVAGQWKHVAWVRSGTTNYLFIDGVFTGSTVTSSTNYIGTRIYVGIQPAGFPFNGYIDDLRITKGIARYTANFTPPGQLPRN